LLATLLRWHRRELATSPINRVHQATPKLKNAFSTVHSFRFRLKPLNGLELISRHLSTMCLALLIDWCYIRDINTHLYIADFCSLPGRRQALATSGRIRNFFTTDEIQNAYKFYGTQRIQRIKQPTKIISRRETFKYSDSTANRFFVKLFEASDVSVI
jgi:hypothetical protein